MVATSPLSPDEIRAAAEAHHELPPEYQNAVIESFLDKIGREIDARLASYSRGSAPEQHKQRSPAFFAISSMTLGIPLSAIAVAAGAHPAGFLGLLVVWAGSSPSTSPTPRGCARRTTGAEGLVSACP
jgi:hypothetical protein